MMRWFMISAISLLLSTCSQATQGPAKFANWFPLKSAATYSVVSSSVCNESLADYHHALQYGSDTEQAAFCSVQQQCILRNLTEDIKARMSSASVLLGLLPGLLASLGPTVSEISLLSMERPLLSALLSFGSPAVYPSRVLKYESAIDILADPTQVPDFGRVQDSLPLQLLITAVQYLLTSTAIANVIYTSLELGIRTTVSFRCVNSILPVVWTLLPIIVHLPAALAFNITNITSEGPKTDRKAKQRNFVQREIELCITRPKRELTNVGPTLVSITLNYLATFLGFLHVTFGVLIFSSLLFIETIDVVAVILRYMVSVLLCRLILMFEIGGIRKVPRDPKGRKDSLELQQTGHANVPT